MPMHTAEISINGREIGERYVVDCRNQQWQLTIDSVAPGAGFTTMLDSQSGFDAEMVKIRDVGGFTGSAWRGGVGDVEARRSDGIVTITGTAYGYFGEEWTRPTNADFTIRAAC